MGDQAVTLNGHVPINRNLVDNPQGNLA